MIEIWGNYCFSHIFDVSGCMSVKVKMAKITTQTKMTISSNIQWSKKVEYYFCIFFKILTITPVQCRNTPTGYKIHFCKSIRLFSYLVIILIFCYAGLTIAIRLTVLNIPSEIHIWSEIPNVTWLITTCLIILIESQFTYKHYSHIIQLKRKIEDELRLLCSHDVFENEKYLYIRNYWRSVVIFHLIALLTEILNLFYFQKDSLWRFYACWFIIPVMFTRFRCFQHRFFTEMIHFYIKLIRMKIQSCINEIEYNESLARQRQCRQFYMNSQKMFIDLNSSMHIFTSIFRMSCSINKMFGFSLLAKIFENFIQTLAQFFWIYSKLYRQDLSNITGLYIRISLIFCLGSRSFLFVT